MLPLAATGENISWLIFLMFDIIDNRARRGVVSSIGLLMKIAIRFPEYFVFSKGPHFASRHSIYMPLGHLMLESAPTGMAPSIVYLVGASKKLWAIALVTGIGKLAAVRDDGRCRYA